MAKPVVKIRTGDWVFLKGDQHLWCVDWVEGHKLLAGRFGASRHDAAGIGGASFKLSDVKRLATQRELLASPEFLIGFQRVLRDRGQLLVDSGR